MLLTENNTIPDSGICNCYMTSISLHDRIDNHMKSFHRIVYIRIRMNNSVLIWHLMLHQKCQKWNEHRKVLLLDAWIKFKHWILLVDLGFLEYSGRLNSHTASQQTDPQGISGWLDIRLMLASIGPISSQHSTPDLGKIRVHAFPILFWMDNVKWLVNPCYCILHLQGCNFFTTNST